MDAQAFETVIPTVQPSAAGLAGPIQLVGVTGESAVKEDSTAAQKPLILITPTVSSSPSAPTPLIGQVIPLLTS